MYVVMRPLPEGGKVLEPGTVVDAAVWPNRDLLVAQRYLRRAPEGAQPGKPRAEGARRSA